MPQKNKVAVFDIDGTIFRSSLLVEFNKALQRTGVIRATDATALLKPYYAWMERRGSYDDYLKKVVEVHVKAIKGKEQRFVLAAAELAFLYHRERVYSYTRELIRKFSKSHLLLAISGSPIEIVERFAKYFDFDHVWGSVFEVDRRGRYTGRVLDRRSVDQKREVLEMFVQERNLSMTGSWGVGDTETDISFLAIVDHPIVFNPTLRLYNIAKRRHWPVVVERKNVIYPVRECSAPRRGRVRFSQYEHRV